LEELFPMISSLFLVSLLLGSWQASPAHGHCSLNVRVLNPKDLEVEAVIK
jgi:hypothetical protein